MMGLIYTFYMVPCCDIRRMLWIMNLWTRVGGPLNLIVNCHYQLQMPVKTPFLGSFCSEKLGNQSDALITCVKYLFWRTPPLKLQGCSTWSRHLYIELCARANMLKSFDLLKTQLHTMLGEVIVSFIVMQCAMLFRVLHLGHLSAVSSASLTWKSQDGMYLLNCFLTGKLRIPPWALVSQNKQKTVLQAFKIYSIPCLWISLIQITVRFEISAVSLTCQILMHRQ